MTDLMNRMLLNSDPYISSVRKLPTKKKSELTDDANSLLVTGLTSDDENETELEENIVNDSEDSD